ncbi:WD40-repeat-containing domain protein [Suillus clintonianus]|uniref:WD40-repeat-containing domain protein n=1 Tax=Suillus clintonianus TaxID=1904413 RepID=UPI001B85C954|nr:WD40-repeat-containing domain protein [Suillus clintonianus]KAG2115046.1 WD40-repeat-containing domain protein [Suillus clintonianus]
MFSEESSALFALGEASIPGQSNGSTPKHKFGTHESVIKEFVFLHDNVHIVSSSQDGTMQKWNCDTGLMVGEPWKEKSGSTYALALSPDGKMIASGRDDGRVQRWNTNGEMIKGIWTGHSGRVMSLSWSPSGNHLASGSYDGTILIRKAENGKVEVGPIKTEQNHVCALAYSPSGDRIASGGYNTICIWNTKTGKLVVGPLESMRADVTSLVWSSDSTKLYSASDEFARVFDSKSGKLLHAFKHNHLLDSLALSPKHDVLACVTDGIVKLWDTESYQPLGQPFGWPFGLSLAWPIDVSFSPDGRYIAYGGADNRLTLWSVKDIAPQLAAPILPQQSDTRSIQQETRPNSPLSSCLEADATGGDGIIEEGHYDPYHNFFQSSCQSFPSAAPGSHLPHLFSTRRLLKVFSRRHPPVDESVRKERLKRKFFACRARSNSSLKLATIIANQPVPEGKVGEVKGNQGASIDDWGSANYSLGAGRDKGNQQDDPPADAQSPLPHALTPPADLDSKYTRNLWKWLMQARGNNTIFSSLYFSTWPSNAPQPIPRQPWHRNSNPFPVRSSRRPVDVAACRDEDRYGIVPESDAEAAAAMLRTSGNEVDSPMRPSQPAVGAQVSHGRPTQTQALTSGPEGGVYEGVSCCGFFFGYRRRSNSLQP